MNILLQFILLLLYLSETNTKNDIIQDTITLLISIVCNNTYYLHYGYTFILWKGIVYLEKLL